MPHAVRLVTTQPFVEYLHVESPTHVLTRFAFSQVRLTLSDVIDPFALTL